MKRAQKKFERDPSKKKFHASETLRGAKAKNHEQSSWFNYDAHVFERYFVSLQLVIYRRRRDDR